MSYLYKKIRLKGRLIDRHRLIMEAKLGRKLLYNECVHHIDGNKANDNPENLEIKSRSEHMRHHIKNGDIVSVMTESGKQKLRLFKSSITQEVAKRIKYGEERPQDLIKEFGISKFVISRIRTNKSWSNL